MRRPRICGPVAVLGLLLLAALLLTACGGRVAPLTEENNGETIQPPPGAEIKVQLESNPSTGYTWSMVESGPTQLVGDPVYIEPDSNLAGAAGSQVFTFKAGATGSGEIALEYRRPWEGKDEPAEQSWSVSVDIE